MNIGIDHGYYAIKTRHFSFPAGIAEYSHEPYTLQNTLEFGGKFYVCGTGRQPILRNKMENDNYYLLTLAAIAKEIKQRGGKTECSVRIAAGLPLAGFGREKKPFREYLLRSSQPVCFKFEGIAYKITIEDVKLFPQGYPTLQDYIREVIIPDMQVKLRQGFGRAIRTETDTCVVSILDHRAAPEERYHRAVLETLPPLHIARKIEDVEDFIRTKKSPDYFMP